MGAWGAPLAGAGPQHRRRLCAVGDLQAGRPRQGPPARVVARIELVDRPTERPVDAAAPVHAEMCSTCPGRAERPGRSDRQPDLGPAQPPHLRGGGAVGTGPGRRVSRVVTGLPGLYPSQPLRRHPTSRRIVQHPRATVTSGFRLRAARRARLGRPIVLDQDRVMYRTAIARRPAAQHERDRLQARRLRAAELLPIGVRQVEVARRLGVSARACTCGINAGRPPVPTACAAEARPDHHPGCPTSSSAGRTDPAAGASSNRFVEELWTADRIATVIQRPPGCGIIPPASGRCCTTGSAGRCNVPSAGPPSATRTPSTAGSPSAGHGSSKRQRREACLVFFGKARGLTPNAPHLGAQRPACPR